MEEKIEKAVRPTAVAACARMPVLQWRNDNRGGQGLTALPVCALCNSGGQGLTEFSVPISATVHIRGAPTRADLLVHYGVVREPGA